MSIGKVLMNGASKVVGLGEYPFKWVYNGFKKNPEKALAISCISSYVLKDGIGCYKYVTQSLHNEKIPEEKRSFVAALDLTNGVLMIGMQILMFLLMRKYSEKLFNKLFKNIFGDKAVHANVEELRAIKNKFNKLNPNNTIDIEAKNPLKNKFGDARKDALNIFKFLTETAAATIVGKRVIVPLIATPLAKKVQGKMEKNTGGKSSEQPADSTEPKENVTTSEPAGNKLDLTSTADDETNLLERYKKYYGMIK